MPFSNCFKNSALIPLDFFIFQWYDNCKSYCHSPFSKLITVIESVLKYEYTQVKVVLEFLCFINSPGAVSKVPMLYNWYIL